jgi:predicted helicase
MKFPAKGQKGTIIYNLHVTISNIPQKAYQYIVNGKSAITTLTNNPNNWVAEHENPRYILDLLLSMITVSMKTMDIVEGLLKVEWE